MRSVEGKSRKTPTHIRVSNGNDFEVDYRLFFFRSNPAKESQSNVDSSLSFFPSIITVIYCGDGRGEERTS